MYGGISRYYTLLAEQLLCKGQNVKIFSGLHRNRYIQSLPEDVIKGINIHKYPPKMGRVFQWVNHAISQPQIKCWNPDIIHETYYSSLPRLKTNALRVTSTYDMIHELFPHQFPSHDKTTQWKKSTFSRVDHIISISHSTKRDLIELFGIDEKKITVVHLGVDLSAFENATPTLALEAKPFLLYVGGRQGYKNFSGFIEAIATSPRLIRDFDVVAFGGGAFTPNELREIALLGFKDNQVRQVGGGDQILASLYQRANVFVYPSLYEGFGLPPLEAMASGCPVVSSNTSSMPEVVRNAGYYFDPNSVEDMRDAIERVVYSDSLREELVTLGFKNVKHFSWEKCSKETLDVYERLLSRV